MSRRFQVWGIPFRKVPFKPSSSVRIFLNKLTEEGEFVEADEIVAVIETDKVNVDIKSTNAGVIKKYLAAEGDTVEVGADFFEIDTDGKSGGSASKKEEPKKEEPKKDEPKKEEPKK